MISITVSGYIDKQPELKLGGQTPKIKFKVVDKQRVKNKSTGQYESRYESISFEAWGDEAKYYAEKLTKGRNVEVMGCSPKTEKWGTGEKTFTDFVYKLVMVNFPFNESSQPSPDADRGNAPQGQPRQQQRYATPPQGGEQGQTQSQYAAEPTPQPVQRSYARTGHQQGQQQQQPERAARNAPAYHDPRNVGNGAGGQQPGQNRFNRGGVQGAPRTQY